MTNMGPKKQSNASTSHGCVHTRQQQQEATTTSNKYDNAHPIAGSLLHPLAKCDADNRSPGHDPVADQNPYGIVEDTNPYALPPPPPPPPPQNNSSLNNNNPTSNSVISQPRH